MIIEVTGQLVNDQKTRGWCKLPYLGHRHGCPNWGRKPDCPPQAPLIDNYFDLDKKHWLAVLKFDLADFKKKMKVKHPDWSDRKLACCLYWQAGLKRKLKDICLLFMKENPGTVITFYPEALGINVFQTVAKFGLKIERNPQQQVLKIALIGYPKPKASIV